MFTYATILTRSPLKTILKSRKMSKKVVKEKGIGRENEELKGNEDR